jgi:type IV pilus secretin PilQ/predicted competence protein
MRIMRRAWRLAAVVAVGLIVTDGALLAGESPVVHVKATVEHGTVRLEAQASGPFEYTTYRPSASLYVLDLTGVSAADPVGARVVPSDLIKGYREIAYSVGQRPMVRLEILLSQGLVPQVQRTDSNDLTLVVGRTPDSAQAAPANALLKPVDAKPVEAVTTAGTVQKIQQVLLSEKGDATQVNIVGSGALAYHTMRLRNPDRLVLDFESSHLRTASRHIASNLDPVREIRLAQFKPDVSRVVIDLREPATYNVTSSGNDVTVAFGAHTGPANVEPAGQTASVSVAKASEPEVPAARTDSPAPVPAPAALLPASLTRTSSALAAPAVHEPPQQVATDATQLANQAAAASNPGAPPAASSVPAMPAVDSEANDTRTGPSVSSKYSGEPISVNLKDVDLRDFFRLIHEVSGLNIVVDPAVKGSLTIVLDDVPWDQALDIVLRNNDLDKQLDGNVLRIATKSTIKKEAEESRDLAKAQAEAADVVTTTRVLNYAKAADMATTLKKFLSSRGEILADDRSNTLVIRDVPSTLPVIDNLIRQLDRKSRQVEIEARVVAANRSFDREFGSMLGTSGRSGNSAVGGASAVGSGSLVFTPPPPIYTGSSGTGGNTNGTATSGSTPLLTNLGASVPTSGIEYAFESTNFALDAVLDALEQKGVGKLLSKPKIVTQNNQKATVKQGTKIPVQTIINNTVSVQFVDAVLELDVTPQITGDGNIYMDVTVENDQIDQAIPRVEGIPAIDTQSAQTRVTVSDGATVVIGGIIVSNQQTSVSQVPVLGSVPIIGNLFKHSTVSSTAQELLFFLTPRILPG